MGLLDGEIKNIVGGALDFIMIDMVLVKVTPGAYNPILDTDASTTANIACRGFVDDYSDEARSLSARDAGGKSQSIIEASDRKITVLALSLGSTVPAIRDTITAEGVTYQIINVKRDPASATYTIQARI